MTDPVVTRVLSATLFASAALALAAVGCAAPTEGEEGVSSVDEKAAAENTESTSQALPIRGGTSSSGGTSTCDRRQQSCYMSCGGAYGHDDAMRQQCENLCDQIRRECLPFGTSSSGGIVRY